jgi:hypothetical protein
MLEYLASVQTIFFHCILTGYPGRKTPIEYGRVKPMKNKLKNF